MSFLERKRDINKIASGFVLLACGAGLIYLFSHAFNPVKPLYDRPYIVFYGRDSCPVCQEYQRDLENMQLGYIFKDIDMESVQEELYPRMRKAGLNTDHFMLPVIDVNGKISVRPDLKDVSNRYRKPAAKCAGIDTRKFCEWFPKFNSKKNFKLDIFSDSLKVSGITEINGELTALIGDDLVRKGDKVGGYEVVEINESSVELRDAEGKSIVKTYE